MPKPKMLDWKWEPVEAADDEPPTLLHRLVLPDDVIEITELDLLAFFLHTTNYLKVTWPIADDMPPDYRGAIGFGCFSMWKWLDILPEPNIDKRLLDGEVQALLLQNALKGYAHKALTSDLVMGGAIHLLQVRSKVPAMIASCAEIAVMELNEASPTTTRKYQIAGLEQEPEDDDAHPFQAFYDDMQEMLAIECESTLANIADMLADCLGGLTGIQMIRPEIDYYPDAATISRDVVDALQTQRDAKPDRPVFLSRELTNQLTAHGHRVCYNILDRLCSLYQVGMLEVTGPASGKVTGPDQHGVGRPKALFPILRD